MKHRKLVLILLVETVILGALTVVTVFVPSFISSMIAFPFEQIAIAVSVIAGTGVVGNGLAAMIFASISLIPLFVLFQYPRGKETRPERFALIALAAVLLPSLYGMINPGAFRSGIPGDIDDFIRMIRAVFGITIWSVLILYIILRMIRLFRSGTRTQLFHYLRQLLCVLCIYFIFQCAVEIIPVFMEIRTVSAGAADVFYLLLSTAAAVIPAFFQIRVCLCILVLLDCMDGERKDLSSASVRLTRLSCITVIVTSGLSALKYIFQLLFMPYLSRIIAYTEIPVVSLFVVILILLFSRLLIENRHLRDDNSLII